MPTLIPNGLSETIQTYIVTALKNKATEQAGLDPDVIFYVEEDILIDLDESDQFPLVVVRLESLSTAVSRSTSRTFQQETAHFALDCYAKGSQNAINPSDVSGVARLKYLKDQVKYVLTSLLNVDFGLAPGIIGNKSWPTFQMYQPEISAQEDTIPSGRWTFSVEYSYDPEDHELLDLSTINAHTNEWDTLFNF